MRAVVQRVRSAAVTADGERVGAIAAGLLVYVAAAPEDGDADVAYVADKLANLRIFPDEAEKLNRSVLESGGSILLVSAFTVLADARKGRRPSFDGAARGESAGPLFEKLAAALRGAGATVATGRFAAQMLVESVNDGPVCVLLDSRRVV